jgi:hydrogenase nickel incorporation protein HypB
MFQVCDLVVINKTDVMPYFNFSLEKVKENIKFRNEDATIIPVSALNGDGIDAVIEFIEKQMKEWSE